MNLRARLQRLENQAPIVYPDDARIEPIVTMTDRRFLEVFRGDLGPFFAATGLSPGDADDRQTLVQAYLDHLRELAVQADLVGN